MARQWMQLVACEEPFHQEQLLKRAVPIFGVSAATLRSLLSSSGTVEEATETPEDAATRAAAEAEMVSTLRELALPVLKDPHPLTRVAKELKRLGLGGDPKAALTLYLAATSRVLSRRPGALMAHCQLNGTPGVGKSFTLDTLFLLFPRDAFITYDAGSARVLIYDSASLRHRVAVFSEADSLPGATGKSHGKANEEDPAGSFVRTLLQRGEAEWKVVVKDETGQFVVQTIRKEGPTTLLTTTPVRMTGTQMDSRLFALDVPEDRQQQRDALRAQALAELTDVRPIPSPELVALQAYLQALAPIDVVIPYARALNDLLAQSRVDHWLLRDAARLHSLIKAATLLNLERRTQNESGRYVAELEDYVIVAETIADMYSGTVNEVTAGVRKVVETVKEFRAAGGTPVSVGQLADKLARSRQGVHRHVRVALDHGWLINDQPLPPPAPMRLTVGEPVPSKCGLPSVEQLKNWRPARTPVRAKAQP